MTINYLDYLASDPALKDIDWKDEESIYNIAKAIVRAYCACRLNDAFKNNADRKIRKILEIWNDNLFCFVNGAYEDNAGEVIVAINDIFETILKIDSDYGPNNHDDYIEILLGMDRFLASQNPTRGFVMFGNQISYPDDSDEEGCSLKEEIDAMQKKLDAIDAKLVELTALKDRIENLLDKVNGIGLVQV